MTTDSTTSILARALDQTAGLLDEVTPEHLDQRSTCDGWTVSDLTRHVVASPRNFITMMSGGEVDWANLPVLGADWSADFRQGAAALRDHIESAGEESAFAGAAVPEFAVHSWDLATSIGSKTPLDDEVAQQALDFMTANLTPENRTGAFGVEQPIDDSAPTTDRLAAFAGRIART